MVTARSAVAGNRPAKEQSGEACLPECSLPGHTDSRGVSGGVLACEVEGGLKCEEGGERAVRAAVEVGRAA